MRELLTHTSGLPPDIETKTDWHGQAAAIQKACAEKLQSAPGTAFKYSDINFFLLGEIVQRVSRTPLEIFVQREIYAPLKMTDTGFLPPQKNCRASRRRKWWTANRGAAWCMIQPRAKWAAWPGTRGCSRPPADLARYARMLLNLGELDGVRIFQPETVKLMTSVQTPPEISAKRGLGWDIDTAFSGPRGDIFPVGSYGHTGWTGGSLWIDPFSKTFVIFLSNRNHPTEAGNVIALRHQLGTLAAEALIDDDFAPVPVGLARANHAAGQRK